jgi:hypothetical protein
MNLEIGSMIRIFDFKIALALLATTAVTLALPSAALAHHSFAMFDSKKELVLDGVVREFQWTNPHGWIQLTVSENGQAVEYSIELGSQNSLARRGWTRRSLKVGDRIKATVHPRKDGSKGAQFLKAVRADGSVLSYE